MEIYEADSFNGTQSVVGFMDYELEKIDGVVNEFIKSKFELPFTLNEEIELKCVEEINSIAIAIDLLEALSSKLKDGTTKDLIDLYIFTSIKMIQDASYFYDLTYKRDSSNDLERTVFSEKYKYLVTASFKNFVNITFEKFETTKD